MLLLSMDFLLSFFSYSSTKLDIGKVFNKNVKFVVSECINIYIQIELKFTNSIVEIIIHQNTLNNNRYKTKKKLKKKHKSKNITI